MRLAFQKVKAYVFTQIHGFSGLDPASFILKADPLKLLKFKLAIIMLS